MGESGHALAFHAGTLSDGWNWLGAHPAGEAGLEGWRFRVWAPHALTVSVVGDFNEWDISADPLTREGETWTGFVPELPGFTSYKYAVTGPDGKVRYKADPYGFHTETRPATASKLYDISGFLWTDKDFQKEKAGRPGNTGPLNVYEVHLGSWRRRENGDFYDYRSMARELAAYVKEMGYNAVELLPVTEHPLDDSWGYQCTGYFAPTSRYGTPEDFMWFVDHMHENGISVILDWVPAHFCKDEQGLYEFDGDCCYEYADPKKREHAGWGTRVFDYGRTEVVSFLLSSARFWLEVYHIDGLRVDAVASMLYLDYDRPAGQWTPNKNGGHENLEAVEFLRALNRMAFSINPGVLMVAEESTAWPLVTRPPEDGGLGFNLKWNMGWMNDICHYLKLDPYFRQFNHKDLTFSMMYAFSENYVLPMSHDEVVHMKGSLVGKMPGDYETQLRSLRGFYAYFLAHPGKKLLFMGPELGQWHEWDANGELDWYLLKQEPNRKTLAFFRAANQFYQKTPALWEEDFRQEGFQWLVADDNHNNVAVFLRRDSRGGALLCAVNFSPNTYPDYRVGVPEQGRYTEVFNTDGEAFGGEGYGNDSPVETQAVPFHGRAQSVVLRIPPFGGVFLRMEKNAANSTKAAVSKKFPSAETPSPKRAAAKGTKEKNAGRQAAKKAARKPGK
ncbi:1,4-alpha-glucan branching protein GlgB [Oscillibacter sp.]|uniref:1,4-alpha-glucan branching protein GlgB n=1 Tax=Oscillibacter sp. TaxID=1945593 RepID=UPI002896D454|nr:1,4-alpha-glucan branching protein GlgB [Oscillibacter sp.]